MAALYIVNVRRSMRKQRIFKDRLNPVEMLTDTQFLQNYRLPKEGIIFLCDSLENEIGNITNRSKALPTMLQVLVALRYFSKGDFLSEVADIHGISKTTASVCITGVTNAINRCLKLVQFPSTPREILETKSSFFEMARFPNVVGVVDGTLIPIKAPSIDEPAFVCRKGYHALNVQAVVDAKLRFTNVVSRWPGSVHDSFIWSNSALAIQLENGNIDGWILGDSGYALRPWLLTPLNNPTSQGERRYQTSFTRTRCVVERAFGVLKSRFRCLHKSGGNMLFQPKKCCKVIMATCQLHNLCINHKYPLPEDLPMMEEGGEQGYIYDGPLNDGKTIQRRLIETRFS